ncbi:hypothetical protein HNO92_003401 [Chromobacterium alkanivorans]|uniref:hypothetical protein n=1 Tax=Chromobacterium alkanivorans TaxID=1071719 RepID=UPI0019680498|nr:hypothetical protein [Chromobacterium alkanivorans]MBN3004345.1 hypothetical protein [Chromobacterium alkanivorans]MCS3805973.1 hypothetical protein [Chromobacterium alkanivorans]MCS3820311.1 hypothetical protein [Chromobacterium alkanivorans]MCS3875069.1 hypothetical protein [Chromobacterium alkanivorans]
MGSKLALGILVLALSTAPAVGKSPLARAIIEPAHIVEAIKLQRQADEAKDRPPQNGEPWFAVLEGERPVIVTAPHATSPFREGQYRFSDGGGTAALAAMLHQLAGVTAIYTTRASPSDPNYEDDNDFKRKLAALVAKRRPLLVLDLHGSHPYRPYDVDFGTLNGASLLGKPDLLQKLEQNLRQQGLLNVSDNYFAASKHQTIAKFAASLGVPAIQLEISSTWLTPSDGNLAAHRFAQLLQALARYAREIEQ